MIVSTLMWVLPGSAFAEVEWTIAPYLWGSSVGLDVTIDGDPTIGTDVPFKDLVDKVDMAFMGHFEGRSEKFGGYIDTIYLDLSDSTVVSPGPGGPVLPDLDVDIGLTLKIFEAADLYRIGNVEPGTTEVDIILGARQLDVDMSLVATPLTPPGAEPLTEDLGTSETDIFGGFRILGMINDRWGYNLRADYATGGTEGTINTHAMVGYTFGQTGLFTLTGGYRYMKIKCASLWIGKEIWSEIHKIRR